MNNGTPFTLSRRLGAALVAAVACGGAAAQSAPPIKSGLWEMTAEGAGGGAQMAEAQERLAKMPPEQRAMVESMMKQHGVAMGGGGSIKMCIDRDSLAEGGWREGHGRNGEETGCKTDVVERGASRWRWHTRCTSPSVESDGEATFQGSDAYTVKTESTITRDGVPHKTQTTIHARWLGADCGDVKPVRSRQR